MTIGRVDDSVDPDCGADRLNFAHKLGHQLGMEHDRRNSEIVLTTVKQSCPWSNDHRYSAPAPWGFRTLMAYWQAGYTSVTGPACNNDSLCPLIDAYSNPQLEWTGTGGIQPLGTVPGAPPLGNDSPPFRTRANDTLPRLAPVSAAFRPRPDLIFADGFQ